MNVRTRFAPSPTGYLHLGNLRSALYAYLFAKNQGGEMVLRIEDTDRERYVEGAMESLIRILQTFGINYDEGVFFEENKVVQRGDFGPYIQSERSELYQKYVQQLLEQGHAYKCFCSKERLDETRKQQQLAKMPTKYDRHCCGLSDDEVHSKVATGESFVVRMKIPEGKTTFKDVIRGVITIDNSEVDDQVLMKSDGFPTYHLAVVVDDHLMQISHIIRAEEWISSTPKHVLLYQMFDWDLPVFAHLPMVLNPDKSKLSKRQGDVAAEDYLAKGYLPEALLNFMALLGYNPKGDQEIYDIEELIKLFDLAKVNSSGAVFNVEKLDWMNGHYIREKSVDELVKLVQPFLNQEIDIDLLKKIIVIEQERLTRLDQIKEIIEMYIENPEYDPEMLIWKKADQEDAKQNLSAVIELIESIGEGDFDSVELVEKAIKGYIDIKGLQNGNVLWPIRVALSGRKASPGPFELAWALGREETLKRLTQARNKLA
ncbi:MAG: glutamate--tRNA ligase [Candidatus Uhrbacteria bacterium]